MNESLLRALLDHSTDGIGVFEGVRLVYRNENFDQWFAAALDDGTHPALVAGAGDLAVRDRANKRVVLGIDRVNVGHPEYQVVRATNLTALRKQESLLKTVSQVVDKNARIISHSQRNLREILDSLPQAFVVVNSELKLSTSPSKRTGEIFGTMPKPAGLDVIEMLGLPADTRGLLELYFTGTDLTTLGAALPKSVFRRGRTLDLKFLPILGDDAERKLMIVVEDVTQVRELAARIEAQNRRAQSILRIIESRAEFADLLALTEDLEALADDEITFRRTVHTLKGGFAFFECDTLVAICHEHEVRWRERGFTAFEGRDVIESLERGVAELLGDLAGALKFSEDQSRWTADAARTRDLHAELKRFNPPLAERLLDTLAVPLAECVRPLERVWRQALEKTGKLGRPVQFDGSARVHPRPLRALLKSLVHLVRNAADHGIEAPGVRAATGKPPEGLLRVTARESDAGFTLEFRDDGAGLNEDAIRAASLERGIVDETAARTTEVNELIFRDGVTSRTEATAISGLGIGMSAVRAEVIKLGGWITVDSRPGRGLEVKLEIPRQDPFA